MKRENSRSAQVLKELIADIRNGHYKPHSLFPSETGLSRRFKVSRSMMSVVLGELEQRGLVTRHQGQGTIVSDKALSYKIGVIIPGIAVSDFFQPILGEIERLARTNGYEMSFAEVYSSDHLSRVRQVRELAARYVRQRLAGVIYEPLVGEGADEMNAHILSVFSRRRIPVVLLDSDIVRFPARSAYDVVGTNDVKAGALIAEHLHSRGARKIHFHLPSEGPITYENRILGAKAWFQAHDPKVSCVVYRPSAAGGGYLRHLKRYGKPDAFVCMNDAIAAAFRVELEKAHVRVPQDVLLTGFADLQIAKLTSPPLTTIHQDRLSIARTAFNRLLMRIENDALPASEIFLPAPLVVRESTTRTAISRKKRNMKEVQP